MHDHRANQADIYRHTTQDAVASVLNGCNASLLCFGQTGSGKTFTFLGPEKCLEHDSLDSEVLRQLPASMGIVLRAAMELFQAKPALAKNGIDLSLVMQVVEVYEDKVSILFNPFLCVFILIYSCCCL